MTVPFSRVGVDVTTTVARLKMAAADRDHAMHQVRLVRDGRFADVWPDSFSEKYPTSLVANFVDQAARDIASNLAPLPGLQCAAGSMRTDADKRRAEKKNRIGFNYWTHSALEVQMKYGADQYLTYGFLPGIVEPDYDKRLPYIRIEDPEGAYYELDRRLNCRTYVRCWLEDASALCAQFPEYTTNILKDAQGQEYAGKSLEVVRYIDMTHVILYLPGRNNMVLASYQHGMKDDMGRPKCPAHIALRPGLHMNPRGQFDDVLWTQLAHAVMAALTMEAGHKAVQAPLAVPSDVNEINIGPDALLVTDSPEKIQRVPLQVPNAAFTLGEQLKTEMKEGAGYPDTRLGAGPAGGSTGRGISALEGGFDSQIQLGQDVLKHFLIGLTSDAFRMDVALWPNKSKHIDGTLSGESFALDYTPKKDIGDNFTCDVNYGFATGGSVQSMIVTLLQLRGDKIIGRDTFRRQLPFGIDGEQQQRELDEETLEDAAMQGLAAGLQATGQMMAQGMAEQALQFFTAAEVAIKGRRNGDDLLPLIIAALQPKPQPQAPPGAPADPNAPQDPNAPPGGGGDSLDGVGADGLPTNVAPGQAGLPPGGRPSVTDLAASFGVGGNPNMGATVRRRLATG